MSKVSRKHVLAAALATALTAGVAMTASAAGRVDLGGLQSAEQTGFDQFIVKYRDNGAATVKASLDRAAKARGNALALGHVRTIAVGAEVVKAKEGLNNPLCRPDCGIVAPAWRRFRAGFRPCRAVFGGFPRLTDALLPSSATNAGAPSTGSTARTASAPAPRSSPGRGSAPSCSRTAA